MICRGGALLIKIPDFRNVLSSWAREDDSCVRLEMWNFSAVVPTLKIATLSICSYEVCLFILRFLE